MDSSCKCTTDLVHGVTLTIVPVPRGYAGLVAVDCVSSEAGLTPEARFGILLCVVYATERNKGDS